MTAALSRAGVADMVHEWDGEPIELEAVTAVHDTDLEGVEAVHDLDLGTIDAVITTEEYRIPHGNLGLDGLHIGQYPTADIHFVDDDGDPVRLEGATIDALIVLLRSVTGRRPSLVTVGATTSTPRRTAMGSQ